MNKVTKASLAEFIDGLTVKNEIKARLKEMRHSIT